MNCSDSEPARGVLPSKPFHAESHPSRICRRPSRKGCALKGIDPQRDGLQRLLPLDVETADIVVFFDPLPAGLHASHSQDWTSVPSVLRDYPAAMADITRRVELLLDRIAV